MWKSKAMEPFLLLLFAAALVWAIVRLQNMREELNSLRLSLYRVERELFNLTQRVSELAQSTPKQPQAQETQTDALSALLEPRAEGELAQKSEGSTEFPPAVQGITGPLGRSLSAEMLGKGIAPPPLSAVPSS